MAIGLVVRAALFGDAFGFVAGLSQEPGRVRRMALEERVVDPGRGCQHPGIIPPDRVVVRKHGIKISS